MRIYCRQAKFNESARPALSAPMIGVPEAAIRALLANSSQPRCVARPDDTAITSHQRVADTFVRAGLIPRPVDVAPLWDRTLELEVA